jgi:hypothetical protein
MRLNLVPARTGAQWVRTGLQTFWRQPLTFISLFFFFMMLVSVVSRLEWIGAVIALALLPAMTLGLMAATAQAAGPGKPAAGAIFQAALQAIRADARPLAVLGVMYALLSLAVMAISALADGGKFANIYLLGGELTRETAESPAFQIALWIAMVLCLPLTLAFWHAPALAHWHRVPPAKSLFFSFVACFRNWGALIVYSLIWMGIFVGASIVLSLLGALVATLVASGTGAGAIEANSSASMAGSVVMIGGTLIMAAMFFTSTWFTFRDSFDAE